MDTIELMKINGGPWVAIWMGRNHHVRFDTTDQLEFVSMGIDHRVLRFTITPQGEILTITDLKDGSSVFHLFVPKRHSVGRDLTILKPYKDTPGGDVHNSEIPTVLDCMLEGR